jgi:hypothetical protein
MGIRVTGGKKLARTINFFKKRKNWNEIIWVAMENVADDIRDDAESKVYAKFKRRKGKLGKSIKTSIARRGNNTYIGLTDHPAAKIMEYGGYSPMPSSPSRTHKGNPGIIEYAYVYSSTNSDDPFFELARGIHKNQPFEQGVFYMQRALREGLPNLESEIMRTAHQMKP